MVTESDSYSGRLTTLDGILRAERLLAAFDGQDGAFVDLFFEADRDVLGALLLYAATAIREVAEHEGTDRVAVRLELRQRITQSQATIEQGEHE